MTVPSTTNYPQSLDTENNLFLVHDSLRVRLTEDYNPGDDSITVIGDPAVFSRFPATGLITLTEQCSDVDDRALSFYYSTIDYDNFTIGGLELLEDFVDRDSIKPKTITNVTQNVMSKHHNLIKDAVIAMESFIGTKGTEDTRPLGQTMEGRVNFLRKLVLSPKAYFTVDNKVGLVPLTVTFTDLSFRLGTDGTTQPITHLWDFGDNTISNVSMISMTNEVTPSCVGNVLVEDVDGGKITKTYCVPGVYDVTLTVANKYGSDSIVIPKIINARVPAPDPAIVQLTPSASQVLLSGGVFSGDDYVSPSLRAPINSLITMSVPTGSNPHNPDHTYAGEPTDGGTPIDPITTYTWDLGDDLTHSTTNTTTKASYGIGGLYDLTLRVDTEFGAYRITRYPNSLDIVEKVNLWLFNFVGSSTTNITAYEYGLISQTFKTLTGTPHSLSRNNTFLNGVNNETQLKYEFSRNVGFLPRSTTFSGDQGTSLLFYASGRAASDPPSDETVNFVGFNAFLNQYDTTVPGFSRPWNWANFNSTDTAYFLFGQPTTTAAPNTSPANPTLNQYSIAASTVTNSTWSSSNFTNGADELLTNIDQFDGDGDSLYGNFSSYRTAWKSSVGYILRNSNVGSFYQIKSFYATSGTFGTPVQSIKKLSDMAGSTKLDGELVSLTPGLYFFNNTGSISAYSPTGGVWETGGPGINSIAFRSLQDTGVSNFDSVSNSLLTASDGDQRAYLSYDYSVKSFIKFNAIDNTFSSLSNRPPGAQFAMGIY
jgi:PKD repeat protein